MICFSSMSIFIVQHRFQNLMPDAHLHSHCVTMDNAEQPIQQPANSSNRMDDDDGCSSGDDNFQEDPVLESEYQQMLAVEHGKMQSRALVLETIIESLRKKLPCIVPGPQGGSWLELCGSYRQGTILSDSNIDVMICFENDEVLPTQTVVDMLNTVIQAVERNEIIGFKVKSQVKFQKQFRLKHILLEYANDIEISVQIECRLRGQPDKTPGRAVGDDCINRVIALDTSGRAATTFGL